MSDQATQALRALQSLLASGFMDAPLTLVTSGAAPGATVDSRPLIPGPPRPTLRRPEAGALRSVIEAILRDVTPETPEFDAAAEMIGYHGTAGAFDASIRRVGLRPKADRPPGWRPDDQPGPYFATHPLRAVAYAVHAAVRREAETGGRDDRCVVYAARVPLSALWREEATVGVDSVEDVLCTFDGLPASQIYDSARFDAGEMVARLRQISPDVPPLTGEHRRGWYAGWGLLDVIREIERHASDLELMAPMEPPREVTAARVQRIAAAIDRSWDDLQDELRNGAAPTAMHTPTPAGALPPLLRIAVEHGATNPPGRSTLHGEEHWKAVAITGLAIARQTPGADPAFIVAFAQLHDLMRENDGRDPEHGERAARLFKALCKDPGLDAFPPAGKRAQEMRYALSRHNTGTRRAEGRDVNVGICWDADRLNLWRVGIEPDPAFLTTPAARTDEMRDYSRRVFQAQVRGELPSWSKIAACKP